MKGPLVRDGFKGIVKSVLGVGALIGGFVAIVFASPPRSFNVSVGDYDSQDAGVAHADAPYAEASYYAEAGYSCWGCGEGEGCGEGCGEGEGK